MTCKRVFMYEHNEPACFQFRHWMFFMLWFCDAAEGFEFVRSLSEGNAPATTSYHDYDENGQNPTGVCVSLSLDYWLWLIDYDTCHLSVCHQTVGEYIIPPGHQVCVSPTVNHRLHDSWSDRLEFNPERYLNDNPAAGEKFAYIPFGAGEFERVLMYSTNTSLNEWFEVINVCVCLVHVWQDVIAASEKTSLTFRLKPSGPLYWDCLTLSWWTDTFLQSTTQPWYTHQTIPSSDTHSETHKHNSINSYSWHFCRIFSFISLTVMNISHVWTKVTKTSKSMSQLLKHLNVTCKRKTQLSDLCWENK